MFPVACGAAIASVTNPGDGGAGKIQRLAVEVQNHFDDVGIHDFAGNSDRRTRRRELDGIVVGHGGRNGVHGAGVNQWLITLHVDIDVCGNVGGDLSDAVGASTVIGAGHNGFAAEGFDGGLDSLVFGGDDDARGQGGQADVLNNVLNHGFAGDGRQGLGGEGG